MRILRIADVPDNRTGGMSRAMYGTGDILAAAGHQVDYLFQEQLKTRVPASLRRFTTPLKVCVLIRQLQRQGRQYDVVEIHEPLAAAYCFLRQSQKSLPPAAIFSHGLEERGHRAELEYRKQKGLLILLKKRWSPMSVILQAMYAARHADHVICTNSQDIQHLIRANVPKTRLTQVHNGIDEELLAAGQFTSEENERRSGLLFVGSWLMRKGTLDLIPAVTQALRRHPEMRFTTAGTGLDSEAVKRDFPLDLHSQIGVIPMFSGNQILIDLYRQHSIFVLPSYFEGQPLVLIEAAAFEMAIVTTNICGMKDFIKDENNGLLVKVGDTDALTNCLERLIADRKLARQLGRAARETAQEHSWADAAKKLFSAYEQAVHGLSALPPIPAVTRSLPSHD